MRVLLFIASLVFIGGCSNAGVASMQALGVDHRIELWSGGQKVMEWTSSGKVFSEDGSDGYYFCDKKTNRLVRVTGDIVVTPID